MEESPHINATELPSSLSVAQLPNSNDNPPPTAVDNGQGQTSHLKIEDELSGTMDGVMEDQQPLVVYHVAADCDGEAEDVHVYQTPNNTVDFFAGVQNSEFNWDSSESDSEGEMQESDEGDKSPMQCSSNLASGPQNDCDPTSNNLPFLSAMEANDETSGSPHQFIMPNLHELAYDDVHDKERSIFVDFDEDADVDDDEARSIYEEDNKIEEDIGFGFGSIKSFVYPQTSQIIVQHLSAPDQQSFATLNDLLSSHNAPGRGLYNVEKVLEHEEGRAAELEEKKRYIEAELEEVRARRDRADEIVRKARAAFSKARGASGIRNDLWKEYEAFCESLEPKFGNRGGWSVNCFENHNGSYIQWDPELELLLQSAEMPLGSCNFRCEATTVKAMGRTEYVVEFWPLANPEPRTIGHTGIARTWKQQYPKLYNLATKCANSSPGNNTIAKSLLLSLPGPDLPFSGGWLFEYALEPGRAQHPTVSRRWSYRSACRIPVDRQQDQNDATVESEPVSVESEDEGMEYDESDLAKSQDVKMEDDESESVESQDVKMEDDD
ncbi:hypothetical protein INS49_002447 [Diaporthe citri]|uniref:uncharacterized protein n=1 Tax=Diaporthe citri TaxID=83186 RepID=UPI001C7E7C6C|nr:uncharacterized protein INS49_002447 [Diaporthe citri]KAG6368246.1 hypothetical protein INS49_002447 [Diaporthe citri]